MPMPMPIHILPADLINKIAAGEVIERPASVVKELVENAIDARATKVAVEIQDAGRKMIRVSDNGCGMTKEEIDLAVQRHSTSKISCLDDLFNIQTLGFRGEALPSIASVSQMKIEPNPSGQGLTAEVKELFYNTPARKKFMKSPATETGHIGEIIAKYTMANSQIAFALLSDGKLLLSSPGTGKLEDAVLAVYGVDLLKDLIKVKTENIHGLISRPTLSRLDRHYITFYVNGRYVRDFLLNRALQDAYRTLIPGNRYPVAVLFIKIDPKQVDVNVHPTKREVKFSKINEVMQEVTEAVKNALSDLREYQNIRRSGSEYQDINPSVQAWKSEMADVLFPGSHSLVPSAQSLVPSPQDLELTISSVQPLFPIYQLKDTYIVATDGEDLVLIDQHAAHERILYDQLSDQQPLTSNQNMLIPETLEFSSKESTAVQENLAYLKSLGFDLEEFGGSSFILRSVPAVAIKAVPKQLVIDIVSEIQGLGQSPQLEIKQENIRKLIACHSAIKAGDKLTREEMNQLIKDLYATANPLTCPHGRPTMVKISEAELNKRFDR